MTPVVSGGDDDLRVMLARLEGKVDAALAGQGATVSEHGRRITESEARADAFDARLRAVEQRPTVSPRAMLAGLASVATVAAALTPFVDRLYS